MPLPLASCNQLENTLLWPQTVRRQKLGAPKAWWLVEVQVLTAIGRSTGVRIVPTDMGVLSPLGCHFHLQRRCSAP